MKQYHLTQLETILNEKEEIMYSLNEAHNVFKTVFPNDESTWSYHKYNVFALTAPSTAWYSLYKELRNFVRGILGDERPLWFQSWINYHKCDEVLDWHGHEFDYHGYICIDPKKTNTVFEEWTIENKPGQIYFGPGNIHHKVEVLEPFDGVRTTLGFDIHTIPFNNPFIENYVERPFGNMSMIPLI